MQTLIQNVTDAFRACFNASPTHFFQAPGRVNLIGEHTDYNQGVVLPCAINFQTVLAAAKREDTCVRVIAVDYHHQVDEFDLRQPIVFQQGKMWANYVRGVVKCLAERGYSFGGMDIAMSGNIPQGAGLSSSASLEVVIGQAINSLYRLDISRKIIALNGQQAENQFVGCHSGIMDQLISACGEENHALLIDCRTLEMQPVPMPDEVVVMIINSNKQRGLVDSEYNTRRQQCEEAARLLGVKALCDITLEQFSAKQALLDTLLVKRARHVVSENVRTQWAAEALKAGDVFRLGQLMAESHLSMRDDFEITVSEIDVLVAMVKNVIGDRGGVRMTGGGCVVALVPPDRVKRVEKVIEQQYAAKTGLRADIYLCQATKGAGQMEY
ncbi:galactokinase [Xenorhabdus sp. IM139775]|uniref:galactokinase n=1 Tax=Xenorhabdus sp. IM139775 TaxID=3025876 RepID=UPI002358F8CE|nr:galactokinase [Xenorhabdus sp. IM139775]MDC9594751.1 galactokinase [Xenorhabdus sp. IM139775]